MKTGRGWWALAGVVAGSALLLLAGYVGVYYASVGRSPPVWPDYEPVYDGATEHHRAMTRFFAPIHWIDRKLRPDYWHYSGGWDEGPDEPEFSSENSN